MRQDAEIKKKEKRKKRLSKIPIIRHFSQDQVILCSNIIKSVSWPDIQSCIIWFQPLFYLFLSFISSSLSLSPTRIAPLSTPPAPLAAMYPPAKVWLRHLLFLSPSPSMASRRLWATTFYRQCLQRRYRRNRRHTRPSSFLSIARVIKWRPARQYQWRRRRPEKWSRSASPSRSEVRFRLCSRHLLRCRRCHFRRRKPKERANRAKNVTNAKFPDVTIKI